MQKSHTIRVDASEVAESTNGTGPYIELKSRIKGKERKYILDLQRVAAEVAAISASDDDAMDKIKALSARLDELSAKVNEIRSSWIVSWNWADYETGEPLPQPSLEVLEDELDQYQNKWIGEQINKLLECRLTEGNARKPNA